MRVGDQRGALVSGPLVVRVAQIALRVVRVVEPPVRDRGARDRGVKHVRPAQDRQRGQVSAEGPAPDRHLGQIEVAVAVCHGSQRVDLILQGRASQVTGHCAVPLGASPWCAPAVGHHDGEALIGEPLRGQVGVGRGQDPLGVRPAVRVHQDWEFRRAWFVPRREQQRGPELLAPRPQQLHA